MSLLFALLSVLSSLAFAAPRLSLNAEKQLQQQYDLSTQFILRNLPTQNGKFGSVAASPTQQYQFHWTRDAALTWQALLKVYTSSTKNSVRIELLRRFKAWVAFEKRAIQNAIRAGLSQGEPKFQLNAEPYTGEWGRPQNDGPALRALVMTEWAFELLKNGESEYVTTELFRSELPANSIIKSDLEFTARNWDVPSFDPWEEIKGHNYYGLLMQRKALLMGAELAKLLKDNGAVSFYSDTAHDILQALATFSDSRLGYVVAVRKQVDGWTHKKSNLDAAVILANIQGFMDREYLHFHIKAVQKTAQELESAFKKIYAINQMEGAPAIGRYPEDVYDGFGFSGGNPWFITTHGYAEFYCKLAAFSMRSQSQYRARGLDYLQRALKHRHQQTGEMSEQISRDNGYLTGVSHLTWSYASFITAVHACRD